MWAAALQSLSKTSAIPAPFCMEMILSWSSSFTHTKNVFASLWKIPLPDGQSLLRLHAFKNRSPSLFKFKINQLVIIKCAQNLIKYKNRYGYLLEKEMVSDQLVLIFFAHTFKWIEFSAQVALEAVACLDYFIHNVKSLLLRNTWSKWVSSKVSSNSDSSGVDHGSIFFWEFRIFKAVGCHVWNVWVSCFMTMIFFDNFVE